MAYETTAELQTLLQDEVGDTAPSTETQARYLQLLDSAHKAIVGGGGELNTDDRDNPIRRPYLFSWARAEDPISIVLEPNQEGTAATTQDSTSVTVSLDSATKDLTGFHVRINNDETVYRITAHAAFVITLSAAYTGETDAGAGFEAFKLIYTISAPTGSILLPSDAFRVFYRRQPVSITDESELLDRHPLKNVREGNPKLSAVVKQSGSDIIVRFSSYPKERQVVELQYVPVPPTLAITPTAVDPIIPNGEKRRVIVHLAAFYHLRKRDDDRANSHLKSAKALFDTLKTEDQQFVGGNDRNFGYIAPFPGGFPGNNLTLEEDVDNIP